MPSEGKNKNHRPPRMQKVSPRPLSDLEKFQKLDRLNAWHLHKQIISTTRKHIPDINPGEIRWVNIGENVGSEISGKGPRFTRPVLILKLEGPNTFFGLPLTHGGHDGKSSFPVKIDGKKTHVAFSQGRTFSILRTFNLIAVLPDEDFTQTKIAYKEHLFGDL